MRSNKRAVCSTVSDTGLGELRPTSLTDDDHTKFECHCRRCYNSIEYSELGERKLVYTTVG